MTKYKQNFEKCLSKIQKTQDVYKFGRKITEITLSPGGGGRELPYLGYIGMCRCEGYGFQAVYSRIGYIN